MCLESYTFNILDNGFLVRKYTNLKFPTNDERKNNDDIKLKINSELNLLYGDKGECNF